MSSDKTNSGRGPFETIGTYGGAIGGFTTGTIIGGGTQRMITTKIGSDIGGSFGKKIDTKYGLDSGSFMRGVNKGIESSGSTYRSDFKSFSGIELKKADLTTKLKTIKMMNDFDTTL